MPIYEYETMDGGRVELHRAVSERDVLPPQCRRRLVGAPVPVLNRPDPRGSDMAVPRALRQIEQQGATREQITRDTGFTPERLKKAWWKPHTKAFLPALALLAGVLFHVEQCRGGDITAGTTFQAGVSYTHSDFNNLVGAAVINDTFITGKTLITAITNADVFLTYSSVASGLRKFTFTTLAESSLWLSDRTEDTAPATNDFLLSYDTSAAAMRKIAVEALLRPLFTNRTTNTSAPTNYTLLMASGDGASIEQVKIATLLTNAPPNATNATALPAGALNVNQQVNVEDRGTNYRANVIQLVTNAFTNAVVWMQSTNNSLAATNLTITHGLGGKPQFVDATLVCLTNTQDFTAGDEVDIGAVFYYNTGGDDYSQPVFTLTRSATTIFLGMNPATADTDKFVIRRGTVGVRDFTNANWSLNVRAMRLLNGP